MHVLCHISIFAPTMTKMTRACIHGHDSSRNATHKRVRNDYLPNHRSHRQFEVQGIYNTLDMRLCSNHQPPIVQQ